jgi:ankyrin repeat protein
MKSLDHVLSQMLVFGDHECGEDYLQTSYEVEIFLQGDTVLQPAACEKYPELIDLLLRHGADVNTQNRKGRSSLMEAALWGRNDNVKHLLEHGVNKDLRDVHQ